MGSGGQWGWSWAVGMSVRCNQTKYKPTVQCGRRREGSEGTEQPLTGTAG